MSNEALKVEDDEFVTDTYTIAHCAKFRGAPDGSIWILFVKTVNGVIDYSVERTDEPVIKFYVGVAPNGSAQEQHRIVTEGVEIQANALDMFFTKKDY